ncbi:MAG: hypothetical protein DMG96_25120 [Acidobacteria bacterium]|nr:MAG: hypothetical protein DMG96_25120 [Acidobacteriota bacterium]
MYRESKGISLREERERSQEDHLDHLVIRGEGSREQPVLIVEHHSSEGNDHKPVEHHFKSKRSLLDHIDAAIGDLGEE